MANRVYLFANFGNWKKQPFGGGEVGNRRTLALLKKANYDIKLIEKYQRVDSHIAINLILLMLKMVSNVIGYACKLVFGRRRNSIVHVVGFYGPMVYFENALVLIAKLFGYKVVYEMRGGGAESYYENGPALYRHVFRHLINWADVIFTQGLENYPLIERLSKGKPMFYYPNFVMRDFYPQNYPVKPADRINMMYFGRVSRSKNIDILVKAFIKAASKHDNLYLDIVGDCPEQKYADYIKNIISGSEYGNRVKMHQACTHEQLKTYLKDKHIYLFPTNEPHEGHSNALTEAMAWGLIPVATNQGFNRSVIGNDDLIVETLTPDAFADVIENLILNKKMKEYSYAAYRRVMDNYTEDKIYKDFKKEYDSLFKDWS